MICLNARLKAASEWYPREFADSANDEAVFSRPRERRLNIPPRGVVHRRFAGSPASPVMRTENVRVACRLLRHLAPWFSFNDETVRRAPKGQPRSSQSLSKAFPFSLRALHKVTMQRPFSNHFSSTETQLNFWFHLS